MAEDSPNSSSVRAIFFIPPSAETRIKSSKVSFGNKDSMKRPAIFNGKFLRTYWRCSACSIRNNLTTPARWLSAASSLSRYARIPTVFPSSTNPGKILPSASTGISPKLQTSPPVISHSSFAAASRRALNSPANFFLIAQTSSPKAITSSVSFRTRSFGRKC